MGISIMESTFVIGKTVNAIIQQYELGTSANVLKIKKALVQKELIDDSGATIEFLDPAYERWFKKNM